MGWGGNDWCYINIEQYLWQEEGSQDETDETDPLDQVRVATPLPLHPQAPARSFSSQDNVEPQVVVPLVTYTWGINNKKIH